MGWICNLYEIQLKMYFLLCTIMELEYDMNMETAYYSEFFNFKFKNNRKCKLDEFEKT